MAGLIEEIKGLRFKGKKAASFGSYGWSGESVKLLNESLEKSGFSVVDEGLKILWTPDAEAKKICIDFGKKCASLI